MDKKLSWICLICSIAVCVSTDVEQAVVYGKISFIGKTLESIPTGSCLTLKVQDSMIADAPSIDITSKVLKGNDLKIHDGNVMYNISFKKPNRAEYTLSATLNMGWCAAGGHDWIHNRDYLTTTSYDLTVNGKKNTYENNIEMEYYERIDYPRKQKKDQPRHHKMLAKKRNDDPCYHAPCTNSICTSFPNGSYVCHKIESMPCAVPMCAAIYEPVCGSNGRTYSSECLMDADSCVGGIRNDLYKVHDGECYAKHSMHEGFLLGASVISLATLGLVAVFMIWRRNRLIKIQRMGPYSKEKVAPLGL